MATLSRDGRNLGGLIKVTGAALSGALFLSGAAFAQVTLDISVDAPDVYVANTAVDVSFSIERTDVTLDPDSDVTALGAEITLPAGWKLDRDVDNNCDVAVVELQDGVAANSATNSTINVKGANLTFADPPTNSTCVAIPATGNVLEVFWIPESGGSGNPLPVNFPVDVTLTLVPTATCALDQAINGVVKYRVEEGGEQTGNGGDTIDCDGSGNPCQTVAGDANGDGNVEPADAQFAFEAFFQIEPAFSTITPCGDFCGTGDGIQPSDAQGIFATFFQLANPCP